MASVPSKNTKPEICVRSAAHKLGYRYRLHRKDLPGNPDMVFVSKRIAIFVHGCFWHGHDCPMGRNKPKSNTEYWGKKLSLNKERDSRSIEELGKLGWKVVIFWECQIDDEIGEKLKEVLGYSNRTK